MKQRVQVHLIVEFDDKHLQADVDEARVDAIRSLAKMLPLIPKVKGKSSRGRVVDFKVIGIED